MGVQQPQKLSFASAFTGAIEGDIVKGVSVITEGPALGHGVMIDATSLETVRECCETYQGGLRVKVNHGSGADAIIGVLRNFRIDGPQLRADLHLLKSHPFRGQFLEMAQEMPGAFGLSISFSGFVEKVGDEHVMRCLEIYSCDIVDSPAANPAGLFSAAQVDTGGAVSMDNIQELEAKLAAAQEQARTNYADLQAAIVSRDAAQAKVTELEAQLAELTTEKESLAAKVEQFDATLEAKAKDIAQRSLAAQGVPPVTLPTGDELPQKDAKKDFSHLKGFARALAAHEAASKKVS